MSSDDSGPDENAPVLASEYILRRILNDQQYIITDREISVTPHAFRPTDKDVNGISVFRKLFISANEVARLGTNEKGYYVSELLTEELMQSNMSVIPDPLDPDSPDYIPGHSAIPELSRSAYKADKKTVKALMLQLATIASNAIVHPLD